MRRKAVVLLSGGIDSSTAAAIAKAEGLELYALSFDYGQRHRRELESAKMVAKSLGVEDHVLMRFDLRNFGGSALTGDMEVPKVRDVSSVMRKELEYPSRITRHTSRIPATYVPARNTIFLSFALAFAEVLAAEDIFIGANAVDYSGYPDCRPEYLRAFEGMANLATKASVEDGLRFRVKAPLLLLTKAQIIRRGIELGLDYSLTWSCYDPQPASAGVKSSKLKVQSNKGRLETRNSKLKTFYLPCRSCDSCMFREKGFKEAGIQDPLLSAIPENLAR